MSAYSADSANHSLGFVPTMGSLHDGHLSLVQRSSSENRRTVVSIFVNRTQFNDPGDFQRYPRQEGNDIELLKSVDCDVVFIPNEGEVFPEPDVRDYDFGQITAVLEAEHRPGHFKGVASVVKRLFEIVEPDKAYFGLKDYQQYLVVKQLVEQFGLKTEIVGCEIVRGKDGLALSSRNQLLSDGARAKAILLSESLKIMAANSEGVAGKELEELGLRHLSVEPDLEVEYVAVVDPATLERSEKPLASGQRRALIAARIGGVRLIDNMMI